VGLLGVALAANSSAQSHPAVGDLSSNAALAKANAALQNGEADKALALLQSSALQNNGQAEAHNLSCRVRFALEEWAEAASECEQAVRLDAQVSNYHLWLGRSLGERADHASFLSAYSLAKRARVEFEKAVGLNPRNIEALADLGEFYAEAPAVVGGGADKAQAIAVQLDKVDAARAGVLRSRIAEQQKDYGTAERELKQAIASSPHPATLWASMAGFYKRRQQWPEMESAVRGIQSAAERDSHAGAALYDGASVLMESNRDLALAARIFEDYLNSSAKSEEAPAFQAHERLARIKDRLGDAESAARERAAARALAREYKPAEDSRKQ
jgi:tetratricopeptide (TPR) repeat protein